MVNLFICMINPSFFNKHIIFATTCTSNRSPVKIHASCKYNGLYDRSLINKCTCKLVLNYVDQKEDTFIIVYL